jgi:hypothetical protein
MEDVGEISATLKWQSSAGDAVGSGGRASSIEANAVAYHVMIGGHSLAITFQSSVHTSRHSPSYTSSSHFRMFQASFLPIFAFHRSTFQNNSCKLEEPTSDLHLAVSTSASCLLPVAIRKSPRYRFEPLSKLNLNCHSRTFHCLTQV